MNCRKNVDARARTRSMHLSLYERAARLIDNVHRIQHNRWAHDVLYRQQTGRYELYAMLTRIKTLSIVVINSKMVTCSSLVRIERRVNFTLSNWNAHWWVPCEYVERCTGFKWRFTASNGPIVGHRCGFARYSVACITESSLSCVQFRFDVVFIVSQKDKTMRS